MRVTSLIGGTERLTGPCGTTPLNALSWLRNLHAPCASNLLTQQLLSTTAEPIDEYTSGLATSPGLFRHAARHRAVGGTALRRRRAAPCPPVRWTHRTHPSLRRCPRRPSAPRPH